jgi:hypothetical protein
MASFGRGFGRRFGSYIPGIADTISSLLIDNAKQEKKGLQLFNEKMAEERANMQKNVYTNNLLNANELTPDLIQTGLQLGMSPNEIDKSFKMSRPEKSDFDLMTLRSDTGPDKLFQVERNQQGEVLNWKELKVLDNKLRSYTVEDDDGSRTLVEEHSSGLTVKRKLRGPQDKNEKLTLKEKLQSNEYDINLNPYFNMVKQTNDDRSRKERRWKEEAFLLPDGNKGYPEGEDHFALGVSDEYRDLAKKHVNEQIRTISSLKSNLETPATKKITDTILDWSPEKQQYFEENKEIIDKALLKIYKKYYLDFSKTEKQEKDELSKHEIPYLSMIYQTIYGVVPPWALKNE